MAGYHKWQELLNLREHIGSPPVFGGSLLNFFLFSVLCCVYVVFWSCLQPVFCALPLTQFGSL